MASRRPTMRLKSLDLPTLGRPTRATSGSIRLRAHHREPRARSGRRRVRGGVDHRDLGSDQRDEPGPLDADADQVAHRRGPGEMDGPVLPGSAETLPVDPRLRAGALHQHLHLAARARPVARQRARLLEPVHLLEAAGGDRARDLQPLRAALRRRALPGKPQRSRGVRALAEHEAEEVVVGDAAQERERPPVLFLRLAREAADDVARQRDLRAGGEADAPQVRHRGDAADELREAAPARVGIHVLPDQGDLADAHRGQRRDLAQDVAVGPGHLAPARVRHHAEAADVVAALRGGDERGGLASRALRVGLRKHVLLGRDPAGLDPTLLRQLGDARDLIRAEHEVDVRSPLEEPLLLLLRHAAGHPDARAPLGLHHPVAAQRGVELVLGLLADGAGVEEHQVRALGGLRREPAGPEEGLAHAGGVVLVHLAAEGVDEVALLHGRRGYVRGTLARQCNRAAVDAAPVPGPRCAPAREQRTPARRSQMRFLLAATACIALAARADGIDRDSLLSEAPAVPTKGTVRLSGITTGTSDQGGVNGTQGQANISGTIQWAPVENLAGDVGMYWQVGANGPSARVRYQILSQSRAGLDLSAGARFKTVGFHPDQGEVEFLLLAGRRFGNVELVLNAVFGVETGGENGKDVEGKAFAGYRFSEDLRAGLDGRLQAEVEDEGVTPVGAPPKTGRDYDLTAGPAVSWVVARNLGTLLHNFQVQGLVGVAQPKRTDTTSAVGVVSASIDF